MAYPDAMRSRVRELYHESDLGSNEIIYQPLKDFPDEVRLPVVRTIQRWINPSEKNSTTDKGSAKTKPRRPAKPLQEQAHVQCQLRTVENPEGDHGWTAEDRFQDEAYTLVRSTPTETPAKPDDIKKLGYQPLGWLTIRTVKKCWFCGYEMKLIDEKGPIDPLADVIGNRAPSQQDLAMSKDILILPEF